MRLQRYPFTLTEITISFCAFALLIAASMFGAENEPDLGMSRTVYTIWATTALVTPALCAFFLPGHSPSKQRVWLLFWTFAYWAYLIHAYFAYFSVYQGSFKEFLAGQGMIPAIINVIFTTWWALDLFLAWFVPDGPRWIAIQRVGVHVFVALTFAGSTCVMKHGFINVIGGISVASMAVCLMIRFDASRRGQAATVAT